jgi:hypothetical protein
MRTLVAPVIILVGGVLAEGASAASSAGGHRQLIQQR